MLETPIIGAAVLAGLTSSTYVGGIAVRLRQERNLRRQCLNNRTLVLTYDDGPGEELTPQLLELLDMTGSKASFFLLGCRVAGNENMLYRLVQSGHEIGCHGYSHVNAWKTWPWQAAADIREGYRALQDWLKSDAWFRPPYGKLSMLTWLELQRRRAPLAWWTIVSGDTYPNLPTSQSVADALAREGGGVVLMHDFDRQSQQKDRETFVLRTTELLIQTAKREGMTVCRYGDLWKASVEAAVR